MLEEEQSSLKPLILAYAGRVESLRGICLTLRDSTIIMPVDRISSVRFATRHTFPIFAPRLAYHLRSVAMLHVFLSATVIIVFRSATPLYVRSMTTSGCNRWLCR